MNTALDEPVMKNRRIRFDEVRTEGKLLVSMLRPWAMITGEPTKPGPMSTALEDGTFPK